MGAQILVDLTLGLLQACSLSQPLAGSWRPTGVATPGASSWASPATPARATSSVHCWRPLPGRWSCLSQHTSLISSSICDMSPAWVLRSPSKPHACFADMLPASAANRRLMMSVSEKIEQGDRNGQCAVCNAASMQALLLSLSDVVFADKGGAASHAEGCQAAKLQASQGGWRGIPQQPPHAATG